ncbi:TPA: hypothetical protein DCR85_00495 [Candidatus Moranbacteria bacterium]|nr:hypothetical protein [Candidatus Moranbacteria bacterium]
MFTPSNPARLVFTAVNNLTGRVSKSSKSRCRQQLAKKKKYHNCENIFKEVITYLYKDLIF